MKLAILIIEDELHLLEVYTAFCKNHFNKVYCACSVSEAEKILDNQIVDVILSDNVLPDGYGINLLKKLTCFSRKIPAIMLTAYATKELAIESTNIHLYSFLEKPVRYDDLNEVLNRLKTDLQNKRFSEEILTSYTMSDFSKYYLNTQVKISQRELEIIELALRPYENKTIGNLLFISPGTVKRHLENIFLKLGISSRTELRNYIRELNLELKEKDYNPRPQSIANSSITSKYPCG